MEVRGEWDVAVSGETVTPVMCYHVFHSSEGINTAVVIKLNHFPGKLNVRKSELCRQSGQQFCDLQ